MEQEGTEETLPGSDPNVYPSSHGAQPDDQPSQASSDAILSTYREQGSLWSWTKDPKAIPKFRPNERVIRCLECYQYASPMSDPVISQVELNEVGLRHWLDSKTPLRNEEQPCAGYKILQFDANTSGDVPMNSEGYIAVNETFGLPPVGLHLSTEKQGACGMFLQDDDSFVFVQRPPWTRQYMTAVLRYNPTTNITMGYIFTDFDNDSSLGFLSHMPHQFLSCPHPLLIPVLIDEIGLELEANSVVNRTAALSRLESETGFSDTAWARLDVDSKTRDYQTLVRKVGEEHSYHLGNSIGIAATKMAVQSHLKYLERLDTSLPEGTQRILRRHSVKLHDRMEYILSAVEHTLVHGNFEQRFKSLQTVLFNLIAQADNDINISLSKDSKELAAASKVDSFAMKIIAFLTTLFLPGTFIATLFAMPMFNWQASSINQVPTPHLWLYWAVTIPLTLATMTFMLSWAVWRGRQTEIMVSRARNDPIVKKTGREGGDGEVKSSGVEEKRGVSLGGKMVDVMRRRGRLGEKEIC